MKNLTNILSYLWLLLLMAVTACSDLEEEVGPMQGEEEVELTIQLHVPDTQASTRTAPTENITAITAYAFDSNSQLIKVVKAILSIQDATSGDLKIKVPKRTGDIHFIAKNNAESPDDVTISIGDNVSTLLSQTTDDLYYWGKATYNEGNNLSVTLIRNMAKVTLILNNDLQGHIAGFVKYNQTGTLVPGNFEVGTLNATNDVASHNIDSELGIEHNLFEHANVKDSSPLFAICKIGDGDLYYKIAFANANKEYFPIIRNHAYTITINSVEESLGRSYDKALLADPINDANVEVQDVTMEIQSVSLTSYKGNTCQVTVTVPNGVTELSVTPDDDAFSVTSATLNDAAISPNNDVYIVTEGSTAKFSLTLNDNFIGTTGGHTISFEGSGALVNATGTATITLNGFMNSYEMYFDGGNLGGSTEYDKFFHTRQGTISTGDASGLETTFYDDGANNHKYKHLLMNSNNNNSFSFTIADTRYLTLLVARKDNAPSINLTGTLANGDSWTTAGNTKDLTNGTYNFAAEGEITTAGRLIRYKLEPGTYTLQRGNNDYLLYYMRVTKDKPTMTDIVQPSAANYNLSWSGGEYGNYLKDKNTINGTKYYVDDDATIFTPKLTYKDLGLSEMPLTTTSVTVVTDTLYFKDNAPNVSGTTIIKKRETKSYNGSNPTLEFNAGTYNNLCGTIENIAETSYKYMAFYDAIQLKEVSGIEVRNTIKVGLYDDWYSTEALDHYTEGQLMMTGFKMPTHTIPVPVTAGDNGTVTPIEFRIDDWNRDQSGLGIDFSKAPIYRFTAQDETNGNNIIRTHPRPEWIYRIQWANVAAESMTVVITDNSSDAYFSHGEQIGKSVTIQTHVENTSLDIDLDFYSDSENLGNDATYDLKAGSTPFYLKATISSDDAEKYSGKTVLLNGTFSSSKGYGYGRDKNGIHWDYSEIDTPKDGYGKIACNSDGTQLQFTIVPNRTDYLIEWVFVPGGHYSGDDINFTYQISGATVDDKACTLNNESQTTLNVDVLDISLDFDYPATFDGSPAPLDNMVFGVSNFYLRATISQADATAFAGSKVLLAGAFPVTSGGGNNAVSWYHSRVEGTINYDDSYNGTGLLFTIDANQQNYFIHWCFERYYYGEDHVSFTYTISKPEDANYRFFRVSGETETSLTLKNSAEIFSDTYEFNTGNDWGKFYSISETFPVGTKITVGFGEGQKDGGCTVKFCDAASQNALKITSFTGVSYGPNNNLYFGFKGSRIFDVYVNETTDLYINGDGTGNGNSGTYNGNLSNQPLEGFKIEGTDAILKSITVTAPESALRNAQDNNN